MSIARQVVGQDFHASTGTATWAKATAAGSLLLLDAAVGGGTNVNLHPDAGWVLIGSRVDHSTNVTISTWAMPNASAQSGSVNVQVVLASDDTTPNTQYGTLFLTEYPAMALTSIVDQTDTANGLGLSIDTGATPNTTVSNDVAHVCAACTNTPPVADLAANTTSYTLLAEAHDAATGTARVTAAVYEKQLGASGGGFQFTTAITSASNRAWAVNAFALKPASTGGGGTPAQPPCRGMWKRDATSITSAYRPDMGGFTPRVQWNQLQAVNNGTLNGPDVAVVDNAITEAVSEGKTMKLRIFCGYQSPTWLINQVGSFSYKDPANTSNPVVQVPCFWKQAFLDAYDAFIALVAARWGSGPTLLDVTIANAMTYYAEPFQRHLSASQNRAEMVGGGNGWNGTFIPVPGAGYTDALNKAALRAGIDTHAAHLTGVCSSLAFNPYQTLTSYSVFDNNDDATLSNTQAIMDYFRQQLGSRGVVENNSARSTYFLYDGNGNAISTNPSAGSMAKLYDLIAAAGPPTFIQTGTLGQIVDFTKTMSGLVNVVAANAVEAPAGYENQANAAYSPSSFGGWNTQLLANPTGAGTTAVNKPVTDSIRFSEAVARTVITSGVISKQVADTVTLSDAVSVTQIPGVPTGVGTGKKYPKA